MGSGVRTYRLVLVKTRSGERAHVRIHADPQTPAAEVADALRKASPWKGELHLGDRPFPSDGVLGDLGICDGAAIGCGGPVASTPRRATAWELRVVGGPFAGRVEPLDEGTLTIGRSNADIDINDRLVSRRHLELEVASSGVLVRDPGSTNGSLIDGRILGSAAEAVADGTVVQIGASLLQIAHPATPELTPTAQADGSLGVNRRFRKGESELPKQVASPEQPHIGERPALNLILTAAPAAAGALLALLLGRPEFLLFMALTPIIGVANAVSRRRGHDRRQRRERDTYERSLGEASAQLADLRRQEVMRLRAASPDPAAVLQTALALGRLLWARQPGDPDAVELRIGSAFAPSAITGAGETAGGSLWMAPVTVPLTVAGGIAITGDLIAGRALARSLVLQAAVHHPPNELKIVVLANERAEESWGWVRWLPHTRWSHDESFTLVGSDAASTKARFEELRGAIRRRQEAAARSAGSGRMIPFVIVVHDTADRSLAAGAADVIRDGGAVGVFSITIDERQAPEGCDAAVALREFGDDASLEQKGQPSRDEVLVDGLAPELCERAAMALAPLRLIGEPGTVELPQELRLLEVLGLDDPTADLIGARWEARSPSAAATVGLTPGGPLVLDLTRDGPHGVVAGTTRSGKSEFLKTLIAALAADNHPDDLSFLFIDFKGGNDYLVAATLPHTVALATQLDVSGFERSLRLLDAEITRRQRITGSVNATTIEGYRAARAQKPGTLPVMGRLLVVVDEFAELALRSPEQLDRLVSVARVGAAYGVHLLLATQRPAGVVSEQIRSNAPLRICFRTVNTDESLDVLGVPDAAAIAERHRGRGFKRAHQESPVELQCARVGNPRHGSERRVPTQVTVVPWTAAGHIPPEAEESSEVPAIDTDFYDLVDAVRSAAVASGWQASAVPWPQPLPQRISIESLAALRSLDDHGRPLVPFALVDDPDQQVHRTGAVALGGGHVAVAGSGGTGRTTALRTFAASLAASLSPSEAHLYVIDALGGGLGNLALLPHTGGVASADPELAGRILDHLDEELRARVRLFEDAAASDLVEYNQTLPPARRLPWLVLLIDGWELINEEAQTPSGAAFHDRMLRTLGVGQRLGLHAMIAGDRWAAMGKAGRAVSHRFLLRFNNPADYDAVGVRATAVPEAQPPGRAIDIDGAHLQIAVLGDGTGSAQTEALRALAAKPTGAGRPAGGSRRPRRIRSLPGKIALEEVLTQSPAPASLRLPALAGVSARDLEARWIDLGEERRFLVGGRRRSGRSTALLGLARSALSAGAEIVVVTPRSSPLEVLGGVPGVRAILGGTAAGSAMELTALSEGGTVAVLVDDADAVDPVHAGLMTLLSQRGDGVSVVVAGTTDFLRNQLTGYLPMMRQGRAGMVLCPQDAYDGNLVGVSSFGRQFLFDEPPGRAVLHVAGDLDVVQCPWLE